MVRGTEAWAGADGDDSESVMGFVMLSGVISSIVQLREAAEAGSADAQYHLGLLYSKGEELSQNVGLAIFWLKQSALQEHAEALYALGDMYYSGYGVKEDKWEAFRLYSKAAARSCVEAQYKLGVMYQFGLAVECDKEVAAVYYRRAAELGHVEAQVALAELCLNGHIIGCDWEQAFRWFSKAADQNDSEAQCYLGQMYAEGMYVVRDLGKALIWYRKSAEQGNMRAKKVLEELQTGGNNDSSLETRPGPLEENDVKANTLRVDLIEDVSAEFGRLEMGVEDCPEVRFFTELLIEATLEEREQISWKVIQNEASWFDAKDRKSYISSIQKLTRAEVEMLAETVMGVLPRHLYEYTKDMI